MKKKYVMPSGYSLLVMSLAILLVLSLTLNTISMKQDTNEIQSNMSLQDAIILSENPIVVSSDSDFGSPIWSGDGSSVTPWLIDGAIIDLTGTAGTCIEIRNTRDFFVIKNCILIGGTSGFGIVLSNVTNGVLKNNTIVNSTEYAIHLSWSQSNNISLNLCENNYGGIELLSSSSSNNVGNNTLQDNQFRGLYLGPTSGNNDIDWNTFLSNTFNAIDDSIAATNTFDSNFWSDYSGIDETPRDGVGDTSHPISGDADSFDPNPQMLPPTVPPIFWHDSPGELHAQWKKHLSLQLNATAFAGIDSWWINDTTHFSIDSDGILSNASYLPEGTVYGLQVIVTDTYSNTLEGLFSIRVLDTSPPEWVEDPIDRTHEFGDAFYYDLNATDPSGLHTWTINDEVNFEIDGDGKIFNTTILPVADYILQVSVNDTYGYTLSSSITITVQDTIAPTWVEDLMNRTFEFGDEIQYDINATDLADIDTWWATGSTYFSISTHGVLSNVSLVPVDVYELEIFVNDTHGQIQTGKISVTIEDTTSPIWITTPQNQPLESGETLDFQLEVWDLSGIHYWILNDTTSFVVTSVGRVINLDVVLPGIYSLRVTAYDPYDNYVRADFVVTVEDTLPPEWDMILEDQIIELGQPFEYQLEAYDPTGITSWYLTDDTYFSIDATGLVANDTQLVVGTYTIEVSVDDAYGHTLTDTFDVIVVDTTAPYWVVNPVTQILSRGDTLSYHLEAADISGITSWSVNNTVLFDITSTGTLISTGTLTPGTYYLCVTASDAYGNTLNGTILIIVESSTQPAITPILMTGLVGIGIIALVGVLIFLKRKTAT